MVPVYAEIINNVHILAAPYLLPSFSASWAPIKAAF